MRLVNPTSQRIRARLVEGVKLWRQKPQALMSAQHLILIKDRQKREHLLFRQVLSMSFQPAFRSAKPIPSHCGRLSDADT